MKNIPIIDKRNDKDEVFDRKELIHKFNKANPIKNDTSVFVRDIHPKVTDFNVNPADILGGPTSTMSDYKPSQKLTVKKYTLSITSIWKYLTITNPGL